MSRRGPRGWSTCGSGGCPSGPSPGSAWASPPTGGTPSSEALGQEGYDKRDLLDAGLAVNNKDGRIYDRFRNRVMFPIIDIRGEVIGFGGRVMDDSTPKYLNSPDTPVYNKSRNMFALNVAKKSKAGRVILTEGYMDTISLHQAGFDSAVASLGTALTPEHAQLLSRYFPEAIIAYDGDGAGIAAAQRAIPLLEKAGLKVRVLRVTGGQGPGRVYQDLRPGRLCPAAGPEREPGGLPPGPAEGRSTTWRTTPSGWPSSRRRPSCCPPCPVPWSGRSTAATPPRRRACPRRPWPRR